MISQVRYLIFMTIKLEPMLSLVLQILKNKANAGIWSTVMVTLTEL